MSTCSVGCGALLAFIAVAWVAWKVFSDLKAVRDTYSRARSAASLLRLGEALTQEELEQHVPAHLRQPGEVVTHLSERYHRPELLRAAVLAERIETRPVSHDDAAGFEVRDSVVETVTLQLMGWFEGTRLKLVESPVEWPPGTVFVLLKERGSKRFACLKDAGGFSPPGTLSSVKSALRKS